MSIILKLEDDRVNNSVEPKLIKGNRVGRSYYIKISWMLISFLCFCAIELAVAIGILLSIFIL